MSNIPAELKYLDTHQWARDAGDGTVVVGITDHAQDQLGDVVFVELPKVGASYKAGDELGVVESVKSASDVYLPISGEIVEVNNQLDDDPELVNTAPYTDGWFVKVKPSDAAEFNGLLDAAAYGAIVEAES